MPGREKDSVGVKAGVCASDTGVALTCGEWQLNVAKYLNEVSPLIMILTPVAVPLGTVKAMESTVRAVWPNDQSSATPGQGT